MRISAALLILACLGFQACDRQKAGDVVEREGESPVSVINEDDAEMIEAIRKARISPDEFESRLSAALLFTPLLHRLMHRFHWPEK
jgi:hypothetical protein